MLGDPHLFTIEVISLLSNKAWLKINLPNLYKYVIVAELYFSNLIIRSFSREIITVTVFGYLNLIRINLRLKFSTFSLVSIERIHETLKTVFDKISKHLKVRKIHSAARQIFSFFF